ncbi:LOW QUALITY PROTEIN: NG,NG-dimethylarginine dimethylaminohydrolase 1 [Bacillus sp. JCM 19045]|nr:LOW QUALITY PROTEIN: NG,NG-dimethylarginine dimethylaminohydrolase 1 [Bacillus sp. JCM 19045]
MTTNETVYCRTEFGQLMEVLVCEPRFMAIKEPINKIQRTYVKENIDKNLLCAQHNQLVQTLKEHGVTVHAVPAAEQFPEQVFMRDSGFTIEDTLYIARMESAIRRGEEKKLNAFLESIGKPYHMLEKGTIEGGDVILTENTVYVGSSGRTSKDSIEVLKNNHPSLQFQWIDFDHSYLHLDCVFQPVSNDYALIYEQAIEEESLQLLKKAYTCIPVSKEEQFHLGVNILSIGNGKIIALPMNKSTNALLREEGFTVIEVEFSEIIKSGGSFRCVTLPVLRHSI